MKIVVKNITTGKANLKKQVMKIVINKTTGKICAMANDTVVEILSNVGHVSMKRASDVEWDDARQQWIAMEKSSSKIIARGHNRSNVIAREVAILERNLL